jgi:hypothetical protein
MAVLVDEASMLDMSLAAALLDALPTNVPVQLLLVGARTRPPAFNACIAREGLRTVVRVVVAIILTFSGL